jgi:hypothetical protein
MFGEPVVSRIDSMVNFDWDTFITPTGQDFISGRWEGFVQPAFSEDYTFTVLVNDGAKLWIDGVVVVDEFERESASDDVSEFSGTAVALVADRLYDVKLEFRENTGKAALSLLWESASQPRELVPPTRMFPSDVPVVDSPYTVNPVGVEATSPLDPSVEVIDETSLRVSFFYPGNDGGDPVTAYKVKWWSAWNTKERQTLKRHSDVSGGTFTVSFGAFTTEPIAWDVDYRDLEIELEKIATINDVSVVSAGPGTGPEWEVTFETDPGDLADLVVDSTGLTGAGNNLIDTCASGSATPVNSDPVTCLVSDSDDGADASDFCSGAASMCAVPGSCDAG